MKKILFGLLLLLSVNVSGQMGFYANQTLEHSARKFTAAAGVTAAKQKEAVNTLVNDIKVKYNTIWGKLDAIYPIVGGTATTHKYNLKDPRDVDAAFRLTFSGTITHASTGMLSNGSTGYANTKYVPSSNLTIDNSHFSFYSRTNNTTGTQYEIGSADNAQNAFFDMYLSNGGTYATVTTQYNVASDRITVTSANSTGFYISNRSSSTVFNLYKDGSSIASKVTSRVGALSTREVFILAINYEGFGTPGPGYYSLKECTGATLGDGFTSTEASNISTSFSNFNTTLSR